MTLFDPTHIANTTPKDEIVIAHAFIQRCRSWALSREIPTRLQRLVADPTPENVAKFHAWVAFRDFLDHTLQELEDGTLDHWFDDTNHEVSEDGGSGSGTPAGSR